MENPSEDGSWEENFDGWPRPRSPLLSGVGNAYYLDGGDFPGCSGVGGGSSSSGGGKRGQQGSAHLPTVPTFEESGTRVSWADYRGLNLAEVRNPESPARAFSFHFLKNASKLILRVAFSVIHLRSYMECSFHNIGPKGCLVKIRNIVGKAVITHRIFECFIVIKM